MQVSAQKKGSVQDCTVAKKKASSQFVHCRELHASVLTWHLHSLWPALSEAYVSSSLVENWGMSVEWQQCNCMFAAAVMWTLALQPCHFHFKLQNVCSCYLWVSKEVVISLSSEVLAGILVMREWTWTLKRKSNSRGKYLRQGQFHSWVFHFSSSTNGQYLKQGKYGAAVVGSHATKEVRSTSLWYFFMPRICWYEAVFLWADWGCLCSPCWRSS